MDPGSALSGLAASAMHLDWWTQASVLLTPLALWTSGAVVGFLVARLFGLFSGPAFLSSPPGSGVRRAALLFHGMVLIRELWCSCSTAGTLRRMLLRGWRWLYQCLFGSQWSHRSRSLVNVKQESSKAADRENTWPVTNDDLEFFKNRVMKNVPVQGASVWKILHRDKTVGTGVTYSAWWRALPGNHTEYRTQTIVEGASAEEMMDFYLDDPHRQKWDGLITHHEILEQGSFADRCQIVRWIRSFPFNFLTDREYVIARRLFREDGTLYGITKCIDHPLAPRQQHIVRMEVFYSMWLTRNICNPKDPSKKACEIVLLHHEQFGIPERLARFVAPRGMNAFCRKMAPFIKEFKIERRKRCCPNEPDSKAYGADFVSFDTSEERGNQRDVQRKFRPLKAIRHAAVAGLLGTVVLAMKKRS